jgi:general secretion pathway protein B
MSLILDALRKAETERRLGEVPRLDAQPAPAPVARRRVAFTRLRWIWGGSLVAVAILASAIAWQSMRPLAPRSTSEARRPTSPPSSMAPPVGDAASQAPDPVRERSVAAKPIPGDSSTPDDRRASPSVAMPGLDPPNQPDRPDTLPAQMRAELPPLTISGSIHSPHASERIVIINGLVLREQGEVVPGLRLEEIRSASVVFSYKGYRFEQPL